MPFRASSSGLVTSVSTADGEAPGYCTAMKTTGGEMSGICSTPSRLYENNPSTHKATMTMVANTGLLMATRVIHMELSSESGPDGGSAGGRRHGRQRLGRRRRRARDDAGLGAFAQVVEARAQHEHVRLESLEHLGAAAHRVAPAGRDRAAQQLALLHRPDVLLPGRGADGADRHRQPGLRVA